MSASYKDCLFTKAVLLYWYKYYGTKNFVNPLLERDNKEIKVKKDEKIKTLNAKVKISNKEKL